jgi:hypothetical protein
MKHLINPLQAILALFALVFFFNPAGAQQITGVWTGKINGKKVEVKIIQKGDSLTGTSYYTEAGGSFRRYTIKGYFDAHTNSVVWWDDQLVKDRKGSGTTSGNLSVADFNCPGGGAMYLDGKSSKKDQREDPKGSVHLTKTGETTFSDEWDYVIDNYTVGANDPELIDSIARIASEPVPDPVTTAPVVSQVPVPREPEMIIPKGIGIPRPAIEPAPEPQTIEEKFSGRKKIFALEIPVTGDSIELRFYDNAQVDGDSISLFLNDRMLFTHIRLSDKAYSIMIPVKDLQESSELTMVAENLGSIPPNTSYMVAIVGNKRYDAQLASTENSSAMIRLKKQ